MTEAPLTGYVAAPERAAELRADLAHGGAEIEAVHGDLLLARGPVLRPAWARDVWYAPRRLDVPSIGQAAKALRAIQRSWALLPTACHRRAALIAERLPHVSAKPLAFPTPPPMTALGGWTLIDRESLIAAPERLTPVANGRYPFVEDRTGPPSRAYLKLWEALTRAGSHPGPGARCLDLGAAPGGWSWALQALGAEVLAVDKAPLAPKIAALPRLTEIRDSAFGLRPRHVGPVDWLVCDVICYPARLLALIERWLAAGTVRNFVVTIKFQGTTDHGVQRAFEALPGAHLFHGSHNRHELTWLSLATP